MSTASTTAPASSTLELVAAELPLDWTPALLPTLVYAPLHWSFDAKEPRSIALKIGGHGYMVWQLKIADRKASFEMKFVQSPKYRQMEGDLKKLHKAFHELRNRYDLLKGMFN